MHTLAATAEVASAATIMKTMLVTEDGAMVDGRDACSCCGEEEETKTNEAQQFTLVERRPQRQTTPLCLHTQGGNHDRGMFNNEAWGACQRR